MHRAAAGVRIGARAVISAGSVVTPDIPQGVFEAGTMPRGAQASIVVIGDCHH